MKKQFAIFYVNNAGNLELAQLFDSSGNFWLPELRFDTEEEAMNELEDIHKDVVDISYLHFVILPVWTVDND